MYYYIIENKRRNEFQKIEAAVTEILTNFDIFGEFDYIDSLSDVEEKTKIAIGKGYGTIVGIGGDNLAAKIASCLVGTKVALGILPLEDGILSQTLGLGKWKNACEILAARRVVLMDSVQINNKFFITEVFANQSPDIPPEIKSKSIFSKLLSSKSKITADDKNSIVVNITDQYQITADVSGLIISNIRPFGKDIESVRQSIVDNNLHLAYSDQITSGEVYQLLNDNIKDLTSNNISLIHAEKIEIRTEKPMFFWAHNEVIARTPAEVIIKPASLKIIGGRLR
jgi:diacylglycerol kinase family enzyme